MAHQIVLRNVSTLLWDFDGVILNSMAVRDRGFELVLKDYPEDQVNALLSFHRQNGGLSRYVKFRYFFEEIRGEQLTNDGLQQLAKDFSEIMLRELGNKEMLIRETVDFLERSQKAFNMHIVSGSDQTELRELCRRLGVEQFFQSIHGSPTPKKELVAELLAQHDYSASNTLLIGDSINDFEAASVNNVRFAGFNNPDLQPHSEVYIHDFNLVNWQQ